MAFRLVFPLALAFFGAALFHSSPAHAALDELLPAVSPEVSSVQVAERTLRVRTHSVVKEFAGSDGKVFAAIWSGTVAPNLRQIFGAHFAEYQAALRARRPGHHHHLFLRTPELEVNIISQGRFLAGSAVLRKRLPQGVTVDALR